MHNEKCLRHEIGNYISIHKTYITIYDLTLDNFATLKTLIFLLNEANK